MYVKKAGELYKLLGDEVRLRLLRVLAGKHGRLNVTELTSVLGIAQSGVSRHLRLLKEAGLVIEERGGGFSFYAGAGLGAAFQDVEVFGASDDSVEFMAQAFAGIGYDISESFQIYGGARYIWIDDTELLGVSVDSGDDVALEIGARFRF